MYKCVLQYVYVFRIHTMYRNEAEPFKRRHGLGARGFKNGWQISARSRLRTPIINVSFCENILCYITAYRIDRYVWGPGPSYLLSILLSLSLFFFVIISARPGGFSQLSWFGPDTLPYWHVKKDYTYIRFPESSVDLSNSKECIESFPARFFPSITSLLFVHKYKSHTSISLSQWMNRIKTLCGVPTVCQWKQVFPDFGMNLMQRSCIIFTLFSRKLWTTSN